MSRLPHKTLEKKLFSSGYKKIIAVDEVGMGCLAGPVVVCAVLFNKKFFKKSHKKLHWLRDSKLLLPHQREKFAVELLKEKNIQFRISFCYPKTIDKLNIYQAARVAMRRAVKEVKSKREKVKSKREKGKGKSPDSNFSPKNWNRGSSISTKVEYRGREEMKKDKVIVLVDGKNKIENLNLEQMAIIKGDRKIFSIACASLIAKVFRDKMMVGYSKKFPEYGFERHKGYATKLHKDMIRKFGCCPIHRKSFRI